jgi:hypothetical protein
VAALIALLIMFLRLPERCRTVLSTRTHFGMGLGYDSEILGNRAEPCGIAKRFAEDHALAYSGIVRTSAS